ncbi:hypothetical protein [Paenibacillus aestuarii]|uniref:Uncharacterized protein n=1 Tax=Paenibacillus aestuarii TaxID=516965 RepID=A0ABW0KGD7_9BACL|nr:hypothetical protein [Paenibacillus aestuarii]
MTQQINDDNKIEVDSDVNEDHNREEQLDDSFEAWLGSIGAQGKKKLDLTNVPQANVYDYIVDMDEDPN